MSKKTSTKRVSITHAQATAAFTLWEKKYRDDPATFMTPEECRALEIAEHGERCAIYFFALLRQVETPVSVK